MATVQYIYAGRGAPALERRSGTTRAYQFSGMSSTRQLTNSAGSVTDTFTFDSMGNVRTRTGSTPATHSWNIAGGMVGAAAAIGKFLQDKSSGNDAWDGGCLVGGYDQDAGTNSGNVLTDHDREQLRLLFKMSAWGASSFVKHSYTTWGPGPSRKPKTYRRLPSSGKLSAMQPRMVRPSRLLAYDPLAAELANIVKLGWCVGCCAVNALGAATNAILAPMSLGMLSIKAIDCTEDVNANENNPLGHLSTPKQSKYIKEVLEDLFGQYDQLGDLEERIEKVVGKGNLKKTMRMLKNIKKAIGLCAGPICLIECYAQFLEDQLDSANRVASWQKCGLQNTEDECKACCNVAPMGTSKVRGRCRTECENLWEEWRIRNG